MNLTRERGVYLGAAGFAAAVLLLAATLARALSTDLPDGQRAEPVAAASAPEVSALAPAARAGMPATVAEPGTTATPARETAGATLGMKALELAVENDPFQQERKRPAERYVLPAHRITEVAPPEPPPAPPFRIIGTAMTAAGGLAVMQVEEMTPRVVALGEVMAGYTLQSVDSESATLVGDGRTLTLPVSAAPEPQQQRVRPGARGRGVQGNPRDRQVDVLEAIRRQMAERGGVMQDVQIENGRVIIRPRANRDTLDPREPRVP